MTHTNASAKQTDRMRSVFQNIRTRPWQEIYFLLCVILAAVTTNVAAADTAKTTLISNTLMNGSFEENKTHPWRLTRRYKVVNPEAVVRTGSTELPAFDGTHFLSITATNESHERGSSRVSISIPGTQGLNAMSGQRMLLRLKFAARTRKPLGFGAVTAQFVLRFQDSLKRPQVFNLREAPPTDEWKLFQLDAVYTPIADTPIDRLDVSVGFDGTDGLVVTRKQGFIDAVQLSLQPAPITPDVQLAQAIAAARHKLGLRETTGGQTPKPTAPIPVRFSLDRPGYVTLVIDDESGKRVRNLIAATHFDVGDHTIYWDGLDEGTPIHTPRIPAYDIRRAVAPPGSYRVRGLVRDALKLNYQFTIMPNVSGTPWPTNTGKRSGGWLGDHGNPTATLFIPKARSPEGRDTMLLASSVNEAAHGLAWTDLDGNKLAGQKTLGGHWTGASHLAYDQGSNAHQDIYAYARMDWTDGIRITGLSPRGDVKIALHPQRSAADGSVGDIAVHNGILALSVFEPDAVVLYDVRNVSVTSQAKIINEVKIPRPHGMLFDRDGRLLVISGNQLVRYRPTGSALGASEVIIAEGLDEPRDLAMDSRGNIYIAEWGQSHCIKVFTSAGRFLRRIGKPGGPVTGPFDPERMAFPYGLSIDSRDQLWIAARRWWVPKAIRVWTTDGKLVHIFYGPSQYGGGGNFDPHDPSRFLYHNGKGGIEYKVDWKSGTAEPLGIYDLPFGAKNDRWDQRTEPFVFRGNSPSLPYRARGRRYITNGFANPTAGTSILTLLADRSPEASPPLFMLGKAGSYEKQLKALGLWEPFGFDTIRHPGFRFNATHKLIFVWTDLNRDGRQQASEFQFHHPKSLIGDRVSSNGAHYAKGAGIINTVEMGRDLDVLISHAAGPDQLGGVLRLQPTRVDDDGMPHYDLTRIESLVTEPSGQRDVCSNTIALEDNRIILTGGPIHGYRNGVVEWSYHSRWPSLHRGHASPRSPKFPGQLLATTRVLSPPFKALTGEAGELWALNSNYGVTYLFTGDGLFVDTLFGYASSGRRWNFPEHHRGMDVTDVCYIDETFYPTMTQFEDGRIVMNVGKTHCSAVELSGTESIRRISGERVLIRTDDATRVQQFIRDHAAWERSRQGPDLLLVRHMRNRPHIDGDFEDWGHPAWVTVRRERLQSGFSGREVDYAVAALAYDNEHLYIAFRSRGTRVIDNEGGIEHLFKNGGGLDLHLATMNSSRNRKTADVGDVRLLIAKTGDGFIAARYRPVVPGTSSPVIYDSPVSSTRIDSVDDVTGQLQIALKPVDIVEHHNRKVRHEQVEIAIPLSTLGWNPNERPSIVGDIGVLVGERGATTQRIYWHNKATGIVSDIPSEARLEPSMWGHWSVEE